jgi:hypothetical protein
MKVKDLIKSLQFCNQDADVILQKDAEGNGYSPLSDVENELWYVPDTSYSGEVLNEEDYEDDEDFPPENAVNCVVLYPLN